MKSSHTLSPLHRPRRQKRRGAMVILVVLVIVLLLVGALFSIDVAYMHMVRAELRTATDAAARAGADELSRSQDPDKAIEKAIEIASKNQVAGHGLSLSPEDIELGSHEFVDGRIKFISGADSLNAVRVTGSRLGNSLDGSVPLFFGKIFGRSSFQPTQRASATRIDRDIALVLDRSGSMNEENRFNSLKKAVDVFLAELDKTGQEEYVSLTFYNEFPTKLVNLTPDYNQIHDAMGRVTPQGFTGIGRGLLMGSDSLVNDPLQRPFAHKSIVLMTDGIQNRGISALDAADTAIERGQIVHTITFSSGANQAFMKAVAEKTGGIHFHADNEAELRDAFRRIAAELPVVLFE